MLARIGRLAGWAIAIGVVGLTGGVLLSAHLDGRGAQAAGFAAPTLVCAALAGLAVELPLWVFAAGGASGAALLWVAQRSFGIDSWSVAAVAAAVLAAAGAAGGALARLVVRRR